MKLSLQHALDHSEVVRVHETSLDVLERVGVTVHSDAVLDLLAEGGAEVDKSLRRAMIPGDLVRRCLESLPRTVAACGRDGNVDFVIPGDRTFTASGHNAIYVSDPGTTTRRAATKNDVAEFARLADALKHSDAVGVQAMPQDVKPQASLLHALDAVWNNSTKHVYFSPESVEVTRAILEMARVVAGTDDLLGKPVATCQLSSTSPLCWESGAAESLILVARGGMPCCLLPQPYSGVTSPITLAGTLVIHNAEVLSGIVISQLASSGAPIIYGSAWTTFDMREGNVVIGSPETALLRVAGAQLAGFYDIPAHTIAPDSDSHCHDEQSGWEKMLSTLAAVSSGVDLVVNAGMFSTGLSVSLSQLVMDDEILGIARRYAQGIEVSERSLALDVIEQISPGGSFLMHDHTLDHLRSPEHFEPSISCRSNYDNWASSGAHDVSAAARSRAGEILDSHTVEPLDTSAARELTNIIETFENASREAT